MDLESHPGGVEALDVNGSPPLLISKAYWDHQLKFINHNLIVVVKVSHLGYDSSLVMDFEIEIQRRKRLCLRKL